MGCCDGKRARAASGRPAERTTAPPPSAHARSRPVAPPLGRHGQPTATVRYRRRSAVRITGPCGQTYEFSADRAVQTVYRWDVPFLLRTGFFESV